MQNITERSTGELRARLDQLKMWIESLRSPHRQTRSGRKQESGWWDEYALIMKELKRREKESES